MRGQYPLSVILLALLADGFVIPPQPLKQTVVSPCSGTEGCGVDGGQQLGHRGQGEAHRQRRKNVVAFNSAGGNPADVIGFGSESTNSHRYQSSASQTAVPPPPTKKPFWLRSSSSISPESGGFEEPESSLPPPPEARSLIRQNDDVIRDEDYNYPDRKSNGGTNNGGARDAFLALRSGERKAEAGSRYLREKGAASSGVSMSRNNNIHHIEGNRENGLFTGSSSNQQVQASTIMSETINNFHQREGEAMAGNTNNMSLMQLKGSVSELMARLQKEQECLAEAVNQAEQVEAAVETERIEYRREVQALRTALEEAQRCIRSRARERRGQAERIIRYRKYTRGKLEEAINKVHLENEHRQYQREVERREAAAEKGQARIRERNERAQWLVRHRKHTRRLGKRKEDDLKAQLDEKQQREDALRTQLGEAKQLEAAIQIEWAQERQKIAGQITRHRKRTRQQVEDLKAQLDDRDGQYQQEANQVEAAIVEDRLHFQSRYDALKAKLDEKEREADVLNAELDEKDKKHELETKKLEASILHEQGRTQKAAGLLISQRKLARQKLGTLKAQLDDMDEKYQLELKQLDAVLAEKRLDFQSKENALQIKLEEKDKQHQLEVEKLEAATLEERTQERKVIAEKLIRHRQHSRQQLADLKAQLLEKDHQYQQEAKKLEAAIAEERLALHQKEKALKVKMVKNEEEFQQEAAKLDAATRKEQLEFLQREDDLLRRQDALKAQLKEKDEQSQQQARALKAAIQNDWVQERKDIAGRLSRYRKQTRQQLADLKAQLDKKDEQYQQKAKELEAAIAKERQDLHKKEESLKAQMSQSEEELLQEAEQLEAAIKQERLTYQKMKEGLLRREATLQTQLDEKDEQYQQLSKQIDVAIQSQLVQERQRIADKLVGHRKLARQRLAALKAQLEAKDLSTAKENQELSRREDALKDQLDEKDQHYQQQVKELDVELQKERAQERKELADKLIRQHRYSRELLADLKAQLDEKDEQYQQEVKQLAAALAKEQVEYQEREETLTRTVEALRAQLDEKDEHYLEKAKQLEEDIEKERAQERKASTARLIRHRQLSRKKIATLKAHLYESEQQFQQKVDELQQREEDLARRQEALRPAWMGRIQQEAKQLEEIIKIERLEFQEIVDDFLMREEALKAQLHEKDQQYQQEVEQLEAALQNEHVQEKQKLVNMLSRHRKSARQQIADLKSQLDEKDGQYHQKVDEVSRIENELLKNEQNLQFQLNEKDKEYQHQAKQMEAAIQKELIRERQETAGKLIRHRKLSRQRLTNLKSQLNEKDAALAKGQLEFQKKEEALQKKEEALKVELDEKIEQFQLEARQMETAIQNELAQERKNIADRLTKHRQLARKKLAAMKDQLDEKDKQYQFETKQLEEAIAKEQLKSKKIEDDLLRKEQTLKAQLEEKEKHHQQEVKQIQSAMEDKLAQERQEVFDRLTRQHELARQQLTSTIEGGKRTEEALKAQLDEKQRSREALKAQLDEKQREEEALKLKLGEKERKEEILKAQLDRKEAQYHEEAKQAEAAIERTRLEYQVLRNTLEETQELYQREIQTLNASALERDMTIQQEQEAWDREQREAHQQMADKEEEEEEEEYCPADDAELDESLALTLNGTDVSTSRGEGKSRPVSVDVKSSQTTDSSAAPSSNNYVDYLSGLTKSAPGARTQAGSYSLYSKLKFSDKNKTHYVSPFSTKPESFMKSSVIGYPLASQQQPATATTPRPVPTAAPRRRSANADYLSTPMEKMATAPPREEEPSMRFGSRNYLNTLTDVGISSARKPVATSVAAIDQQSRKASAANDHSWLLQGRSSDNGKTEQPSSESDSNTANHHADKTGTGVSSEADVSSDSDVSPPSSTTDSSTADSFANYCMNSSLGACPGTTKTASFRGWSAKRKTLEGVNAWFRHKEEH